MRPHIHRFLTLSLTGLLAAGSLALAEEKTYNVSGPVGAIDANAISLTQGKGKEKYVIRRTSATQTTGSVKPGDVARIEYSMTATSIAPKGTKTTPPAGEKIYHVSGPIFAIDASSISLTQGKGTEKYVISRSSATQTAGSYKVGDVVRVGYFMTATSIGFKEAGKPGAVVAPVVPRGAPAVTAPVVPAPVQAAPSAAPVVTAPAPAAVPSAPVSAPATRSMPAPAVVPPTAASIPAPSSTTTAAAEAAAPVKKVRKTKAQKATDATTSAPDAAAATTPAKKTRKTKAQTATDATTSASAPATTAAPDAAAAATPAKKARKTKTAKTGDVVSETATPNAEAAATPTPSKKTKKTKKQKADEAAANGTTPKRVAPKGIQPAEQMPVPTPTPPAR